MKHVGKNPEQRTVVQLNRLAIGNGSFTVIAGPEHVEGQTHIHDWARFLKATGAGVLASGCFKVRATPVSSDGLDLPSLALLSAAGAAQGLPIATEVRGVEEIEFISRHVDLLIINQRNMQNFPLLTAIGKTSRPVILQRGIMASVDELLNSAEYILAQGNHNVILCECGTRTFGDSPFAFDLAAIPRLRALTHLPLLAAPNLAGVGSAYLDRFIKAIEMVGGDGVIIELGSAGVSKSEDPQEGLSRVQFEIIMDKLNAARDRSVPLKVAV